MRGDEREMKMRADLYFQIGEASFDFHAAAVEQETFVGVLAAGHNWITAQDA